MDWGKESIKSLPKVNGVYALYHNEEIVYIGESKNIRDRLTHHYKQNGSGLLKTIAQEEDINTYMSECTIKILPIKIGRSEIEEYLIHKLNPRFNNYKRKQKSIKNC